MTQTAWAMAGYIAWTLLLIVGIEVIRTLTVVRTARAPNTFAPDGRDVSPFANRLCRAHANCYESFPLIGGVGLLALATGDADVTDPLALWMLAARIAQSSIHLVSGGVVASQLRFVFFVAQLVVIAFWLALLGAKWSSA